MPHVIVKMYAGRTDEQKKDLAAAIARSLTEIAGATEANVSVAVEDFDPDEWPEAVYRPDILEYPGTLIRRPGYNPFET